MSLVVDSSVTLAFFLAEELSPPVEEVWDKVLRDGAWAPSVWKLEVANALLMAVRTQRVNGVFLQESVADLATYWIEIDLETGDRAWDATLKLAEQHRLTLYDAAYLELAMRRRLPLATLDKELRAAANLERVVLFGM